MKYIGKDRALFVAHKMKSELVYNMAKAEGNTLSFEETETVMQGISVGGKRMFELKQIERLQRGWDEIIYQVKNDLFTLEKQNFILINKIVSEEENPETGDFRQRNVKIGGTKWEPPLPMLLNEEFRNMKSMLDEESDVEKKAFDIFLMSARTQFFGDGNKRTAQLMMNGYLMSNGYSLFSIAPEYDAEFKKYLLDYYLSNDKSEILNFLGKLSAQIDTNFNLSEPAKNNSDKINTLVSVDEKREDLL